MYEFGQCNYQAKVWQNGDWRDHLNIAGNNLIRSLNVRMYNGNIMNAVKFKLLIPGTRNYYQEAQYSPGKPIPVLIKS